VRLEAVYDREGVIVAAIAFDSDEDLRPRPQPGEGQQVGVFDVPGDRVEQPLDELCRNMVVDAAGGVLVDRGATEAS
jgi:hypothetical protein